MLMDQWAYGNALRFHHPLEKASLAFGGVLFCLLAPLPFWGAMWALFISAWAIFKARIPLNTWLRLLWIPLGFLLLSGFTLALEWGLMQGKPLAFAFPHENCTRALGITSRSFGAFTSLIFLGATTPMGDLLDLLRNLKCPETLLDLCYFTYRGIWILWDEAFVMHRAQASRLGHGRFSTHLRSLSLLASKLWISAMLRAQTDFRALQSRCFEDRLRLLPHHMPLSKMRLGLILAFFVMFFTLSHGLARP